MNKVIGLSLLLLGCGGDQVLPPVETCSDELLSVDYLITGQSNAMAEGVDWSYFEDKTGFKTYNIAVGGKMSAWLRRNLDVEAVSCMKNLKGVFYIHGEADSMYGNAKDYRNHTRIYLNNILEYSGAESVYISTVGYRVEPEHDGKFEAIRSVQYLFSQAYENWHIAFDDAKRFRDWGMLEDQIHFSEEGDQMMMDAFAESVWSTQ